MTTNTSEPIFEIKGKDIISIIKQTFIDGNKIKISLLDKNGKVLVTISASILVILVLITFPAIPIWIVGVLLALIFGCSIKVDRT